MCPPPPATATVPVPTFSSGVASPLGEYEVEVAAILSSMAQASGTRTPACGENDENAIPNTANATATGKAAVRAFRQQNPKRKQRTIPLKKAGVSKPQKRARFDKGWDEDDRDWYRMHLINGMTEEDAVDAVNRVRYLSGAIFDMNTSTAAPGGTILRPHRPRKHTAKGAALAAEQVVSTGMEVEVEVVVAVEPEVIEKKAPMLPSFRRRSRKASVVQRAGVF